MSFKGRYSDGRTAVTAHAEVRISATALEIQRSGSADPVRWPYSSLRAAQPIRPQSGDVLLSSSTQDGATLYVDDAAFVRSLAKVAPSLTARHVRLARLLPWTVAAALIAIAALGGWLLELSPARAVASLLPDKARKALGEHTIDSMVRDRQLCTAPEGVGALERLTQRLVMGAPGKAPEFRVIVVDWALQNAFATAGEQIVLTRGLISNATSPDEVAGVLAHEMGHGLEMHPEAALVRALGLSAITELLLGGSGGLSNIGVALAQLSYSRAAEREADAHALAILRGARISQRGLSDFFTRIEEKKARESGLTKTIGDIGVLRTHPVTAERKKAIDETKSYLSTPALDRSDWQSLQAICSVTSKR